MGRFAGIFGLGNPGSRYLFTRHNVGFMVLDAWAVDLGLSFRVDADSQSEFARLDSGERLIKPQTFMNNSGESVAAWSRMLKWELSEILIVVDDVNLDFGELRLRKKGSSGGQNGLKSIEQHLGSQEYARLRCGVGRLPAGWKLENWVLSKFKQEDETILIKVIQRARQAIECCQIEGIDVAMGRFNGDASTVD
jgi:PTH1 family peptidyl-tRNA hydrolase